MTARRTSPPVCTHRWVIDPPNGRTSRGVCMHCGAERQFLNWVEDDLGTRIGIPNKRRTQQWKEKQNV